MKVRFGELEVEAEPGETLLEVAQRAGVPVGTHCGGVCACSKCHVYVTSGTVSPMQDDERDMLELAARDHRPSSRLGCQTRLIAPSDPSVGPSGVVAVSLSQETFEAHLEDREPAERGPLIARWSPR